MADWSSVPEELLSLISESLDTFVDYRQLSYVCNSWRFLAIPQPPFLMLPRDQHHCLVGFDEKVHKLDLPEIQQKRLLGSSGTWVVTVDMELKLQILSLFSHVQIDLPPQSTLMFHDQNSTPQQQLRDLTISRVVLASLSRDCTVAIAIHNVFSKKIAIAKPGDKTWTTVQGIQGRIEDVVYFKKRFYAIAGDGILYTFDLFSSPPRARRWHKTTVISAVPVQKMYLVEWSGELVLVTRHGFLNKEEGGGRFCETCEFRVYRFDFGLDKWRYVKSLGEYSLFLGLNTSRCILASELGSTVKRNCIYFTDDINVDIGRERCLDMGVFDLEDDTVRRFYPNIVFPPSSPPVWIVPSKRCVDSCKS